MTIDPTEVIGRADRLLERHPEAFSDEFGRNKDAVQALAPAESLSVRNRIAGYITRRKRSN